MSTYFLSKYIKNVVVRWDSYINPIRFMVTQFEDVKQLETVNEEHYSEIIVEDTNKLRGRIIRIRVK